MEICADQIRRVIPGAQLLGDEEVLITHAAPLARAGAGSVSWLKSGHTIPVEWDGAALIIGRQTIGRMDVGRALIRCENPRLGLGYALKHFFAHRALEPEIGEGENVRIHPSAVIGAEGAALEWDERDGRWFAIPHIAGVVLGDDVVIGPLATVMRGLLQDTEIGYGSYVGGHANVGHGAQLGRHCQLLPYASVGGSATLSDRVVVGMGARIKNGVSIGARAVIGQSANVLGDVPSRETWVGNPARPLKEYP